MGGFAVHARFSMQYISKEEPEKRLDHLEVVDCTWLLLAFHLISS